MKKILGFLLMVIAIYPLQAQQRTGNIYGRIIDLENNPLPGVTVTLTGGYIAPMSSVSSEAGAFRFISLPAGTDYAVKCELQGFKPQTRTGIIVSIGTNVDIVLTMEIGGLEEEVTVTATVPIVDRKKTSMGQVVTQDILQSLPSARDPWVIAQMTPTIQIDRENVGGSESGQQSGFSGAGGMDDMNNVWAVDGAVITDTKSSASPIYYDFDSFEEMSVSVGGSDVTVQTGGVSINMVTRRGGNRLSLGGRYYLTDQTFQANNLTDDLIQEGVVGTNKITSIKDFGVNLGGPIIKDKAWIWGSFGTQDVKGFVLTGAKNDALLVNYNLKLNLQLISQNRFEIYGAISEKTLDGKYASYSDPLGYRQTSNQHFGSPLLKIQDEHTFGNNLFISAKYVYVGGGNTQLPEENLDLSKIGVWDVGKQQFVAKYDTSARISPRNDYGILLNYFNDKFFGMSHEIKAGFEYSDRRDHNTSEFIAFYEKNWNEPIIDFTGDGIPDINTDLAKLKNQRFPQQQHKVLGLAGYLSDTISTKRLTFLLGLRYDRQTPSIRSYPVMTTVQKDRDYWENNISSSTADAIGAIFPTIQIPDLTFGYSWNVFSPRLGVTWDIEGSGRTVAKFAVAQYGDFMWTKINRMFDPLGTSGFLDFWWLDDNLNGITDLQELYWYNPENYAPYRTFDDSGNFVGNYDDMEKIMWGSYDPENPLATSNPATTVDRNAGSTRTREISIDLEREVMKDFAVTLNLTYRIYDKLTWSLDYFPSLDKVLSQSDYVVAGTIPDTVGGYSTGEASGKPYYLLSSSYGVTKLKYFTNTPDKKNTYLGVNLVFDKRLSKKWMMNGSLSWQKQASYYGENGYVDPTNIWALEGQPYSMYISSGTGKVPSYIYSRWLVKLQGLYELPYGINVGATLNAREGYVIPEYFKIRDLNAPNSRYQTTTVYIHKFGTDRLSPFANINLKIQKRFQTGQFGNIYLSVDAFNVLNSSVITRRYDKSLGTYYPHDGSFVADPTNYLANEILNPRILRFGIRFQY